MTRSTSDPRRPFGRLVTAMVTPFRADGSLDVEGAGRLASYLVDEQGNDALVVNGTTGESPTTSDAEKETLVRAVLEAVGDRAYVIAGVGTNDTHHTIELAKAAEKAGAHATLVVKDAKGDFVETSWVTARTDLAYYSGDDKHTLPLLAVGAVGVVGVPTHVFGRQTKEMIEAYEAGDVARALALHHRLLPVFIGFFRTQGAILTKAALSQLGLPGGPMRPPLVDVTASEIARLREDCAAAGLTLGSTEQVADRGPGA